MKNDWNLPQAGQDRFIPTRKSLLSRLKNWEDQASWQTFFDTYYRLIYTAALRAGLSDAEAEDVVQDTIISVCKKIPQFQYDPAKGAFKGWLMNLTWWRIRDQLRKRQRGIQTDLAGRDGVNTDDLLERVPDPSPSPLEEFWEQEWERNLMEAAVERVKKRVDAKLFQAFDLYVLREWPVARVTHALKITKGTVYLAKHRISALIKKELEELRDKPI
jgi:RNA polymerase sigma factor (sigma-70 family)